MLIRRSAEVNAALSAVAALVVLPRDDLLVVRVRPLDQPGEDLGRGRAEAEMVVAPGDLDFLLGAEQPADLLERLGRHDQIGLGRASRRRRGNVHPRQPVAVGGHHAHPLGPELPEHAVQDRPALLGARREGHVGDQLLQILRRRPPAALELDGGEGGELLARQTEEPELGAAALDGDPLLARRGEPDGGAGKLAHDLDQLAAPAA